MNEPSSRDHHWLDERLRGVGVDPAELEVVRSPMRPVIERGDPWQVDVRLHDFAALILRLLGDRDDEENVEGKRGRVVAVTDVEEDPVGRVQTAVLLARRLQEEGRSVLLVDADLRHVGLSRWLADRDLDAEGLVDVLEYGASVAAVLRKGPIERVSLLSVGSYRPDATDLFDDHGLGRLVVQLRGAADVILVVVPAWLANARFHPLLVHADSVVVSVHLDLTLAPALEDLLRYLRGLNVTIGGLVTFAGPDSSEKRVDELLREADPWRVPEDVDDIVGPPSARDSAPDARAPFTEPVSGLVVPAVDRDPASGPRGFRRRPTAEAEKSSPVLRVALILAVIVLLAFVGWWGLTQREHPPARTSPLAQRPAAQVPVRPAPVPAPATTASPTGEAQAAADSILAEDTRVTTVDDAAPEGTVPLDVEAEPSGAGGDETPAAVDQPASVPEPLAETPSLQAAALARPVGGGFALHLYSFPDSSEALTVLPRLRGQGWQPVVMGADVPDKGRWYRVLIGRFESRASATAAIDEAKRRAGVDWVGVVRVP